MAEPLINSSNLRNRYAQKAGNWARRHISQSPRLSRVANILGERLYDAGAKLINRFGPETLLKPRDFMTICDILGIQKKTLYYKMQPDGTIVDISGSVEEFLGISAKKVLEQKIKFDQQIRDDLKPGVGNAFREGVRTGDIWGGLTKIRDISGKWHTIDTYLRATYDERGNILSTVGIVFDVTDIRATEKELKIMLNAHESIMRIHEMISQQKDIKQILDEIVKVARKILPIDACAIKKMNEFGKLELVAKEGLSDLYGTAIREEGQKTLSQEAHDNGSIIGTNNIKAFLSTADEKYESGLYAGLGFGGKQIGVMTMYRTEGSFTDERKHVFTEEEIQADPNLKLIRLFVRLISNAINNAELASLDSLTHLNSRRAVEEMLLSGIHNAIRTKDPFTVLIMDVDDFKVPNDAFGNEPHGDNILKAFARILQGTFFHGDILGRKGGDEFIAGLANVPKEQALSAAEKVRKNIENATVRIRANVDPEKIAAARNVGMIYRGMDGDEHLIGFTTSIGGIIISAEFLQMINLNNPLVAKKLDNIVCKIRDKVVSLAFLASKRAKKLGKNRILIDDGGTALSDILEEFHLI